MKRNILVKQRDITDCGAACLASIAAYHNLKLPVSRIRQLAGTDQKGTNALGMLEAAESLGFEGKGVKGTLEALPEAPLPCIAHVVLKNQLHHYVVIYRITGNKVIVMDPAMGKLTKYSRSLFADIWSGVLLLLSPGNDFVTGDQKVPLIKRMWFLIRPHRQILGQAVVGAMLFTLIGLSGAIFVQKIIDSVIPSHNQNLLNLLGMGMLILLAFQVILNVLRSIFVLKVGQQIDAKLILGYYKHILNLPQRFFDTMRVGEITSRIGDVVKIRVFLNQTAIDLIINGFVLFFSFGLMFTYYWKLALILALVIPLYLGIYLITDRLNRRTERKVMEHAADLESQLIESLNSVRTIKSFGVEDHANLRTEVRFVNLLSTVYTSGLNSIFAGNASLAVSRGFTIVLLWAGTTFVFSQQLTSGELMSFYAIIGYFTGPVGGLIGANKVIQNARIAADRLFEVMDLEQAPQHHQFLINRDDIGDIAFQNVRFRYGTRTEVFQNLSFQLQRGSFTAIVGESGSGKSTLASILKRLYPIDKGKVYIGNHDLSMIQKSAIDSLIGIVPQQIDLFAGSLVDNIAIGQFQPDIKRIAQLTEELGMLDFIQELPNGFGTYLGENGVNLSGGQRQRLAILRALYTDPEIVIFDEATSALDTKSERFVMDVLQKLKTRGKTIIMITHRLSSAREADEILVLEKGKLVGQGKHEQLLLTSAPYAAFWTQHSDIKINGHG